MKQEKKKLSVPRELEEIQKDYGNSCFEAGQCQYLINQKSSELKLINEHIRKLNNEAAARKQLNAQKAEEAKEVTNVQQ
jgi:hypothetical protein